MLAYRVARALTLSTYAHAIWGRQGELAKAIGAALK
jgi:hypothetical protein